MIFGDWLKKALKNKNIKQAKLAELLKERGKKAHPQQVNSWIKGNTLPSAENIIEIFDILEESFHPTKQAAHPESPNNPESKTAISPIDNSDPKSNNSGIPNKLEAEEPMSDSQKDQMIDTLLKLNKKLETEIEELKGGSLGKPKSQGRRKSSS